MVRNVAIVQSSGNDDDVVGQSEETPPSCAPCTPFVSRSPSTPPFLLCSVQEGILANECCDDGGDWDAVDCGGVLLEAVRHVEEYADSCLREG